GRATQQGCAMALRSGQGQRKKYLTMDLSNLSTFVRNLRAVVSEFQFAKIGVQLTPAERHTLLAWQRATTISAGRARRGRILLLMADGVPIAAIAAMVGISRRFVYKWVQRFLEQGMEGLTDKPGRGSRRMPRESALVGQYDACG